MDVWTSLTSGEQYGVWFALSGVFIAYALILCPLRYAYKQRKFRYQISTHLVTSSYKLPEELTPAELSYLFSRSISRRHLNGSLMQLVNEGILSPLTSQGKLLFSMGPRVDSKIALSSAYLIDMVEGSEQPYAVHDFSDGTIVYRVPNTHEEVKGSKIYVFWWLVREGLRQRGVIVKRPLRAYFLIIFKTQLLTVIVSLLTVIILHAFIMTINGEIELEAIRQLLTNAAFWFGVTFIATFTVSAFTIRLKGQFLGRDWILTGKKKRLLNQFDAFREYVRLVQKGDVAFENNEAQRAAELRTLPYAVALGYALPPSAYQKER